MFKGFHAGYSLHPVAVARARQTSFIFWAFTVPTKCLRLFLSTVCIWSRLMAESRLSPSLIPTITSLGAPRIVEVIGATITVWRTSIASLRDRTRTGRRLSGRENANCQISARFILAAIAPDAPRTRIPRQGQLSSRKLVCMPLRFLRGDAVSNTLLLHGVVLLNVRPASSLYQRPAWQVAFRPL